MCQNERFQCIEIYETADISTNTVMSNDCKVKKVGESSRRPSIVYYEYGDRFDDFMGTVVWFFTSGVSLCATE